LTAYASDWRDFEKWCNVANRSAIPADPETVALYLGDLSARFKCSTLERRVAAIRNQHFAAGLPSPTTPAVRAVIAGARRHAKSKIRKMAALSIDELLAMSLQLDAEGRTRSTRDRALLLLGFGGAFRRSELAGLDLDDIDLGRDRVAVTLNRSKTDQHGRGRQLVIPRAQRADLCPVCSLQDWLKIRGSKAGPLFTNVNKADKPTLERIPSGLPYYVVRTVAKRAGIDFSRFGAHSLRAGFCTAAADAGADVFEIMATSGHKSVENVQKYVRRSTAKYPLRKVL
jgi:integrase